MGASQIVYIRTDGNADIAAGHIMRCLTIAEEIIKKNHPVCFLTADKESHSILVTHRPDIISVSYIDELLKTETKTNIFSIQLKQAHYQNMEPELPELKSLLAKKPGPVLIDSYFVTEHYLNELHEVTATAYIDDIYSFKYAVDLLINYDCFTEERIKELKNGIYKDIPVLLLGAKYAPLRPQFLKNKVEMHHNATNIFVTTGSSDPYHFILEFAKLIDQNTDFKQYHYHLVIGSLNTDYHALKQLANINSNIHLYTGLTDLMPLMQSCDLAISAGGTTLYELCTLGIPSFSFSMADNQLENPKILDEQELVPYGGDIRTDMPAVLEKSIRFIAEYSCDYDKRKTVHAKMNSLFSGDGASQIADALLNLSFNLK